VPISTGEVDISAGEMDGISAGEVDISAGEVELHCCGERQQRRLATVRLGIGMRVGLDIGLGLG
jgi:hypothetical protein